MPKAAVDDPSPPSCSLLLSEPRIAEDQLLAPDPGLPRARDARGRFAEGSSGNPRGRPRGIRNPKRRTPDLAARPLGAQALSDLIDRKPELLLPLAAQLLPPPLAAADPAERLGIDLSAVQTMADFRRLLSALLAAVGQGEIAPAAAARLAGRVEMQLREAARSLTPRSRGTHRILPTPRHS